MFWKGIVIAMIALLFAFLAQPVAAEKTRVFEGFENKIIEAGSLLSCSEKKMQNNFSRPLELSSGYSKNRKNFNTDSGLKKTERISQEKKPSTLKKNWLENLLRSVFSWLPF